MSNRDSIMLDHVVIQESPSSPSSPSLSSSRGSVSIPMAELLSPQQKKDKDKEDKDKETKEKERAERRKRRKQKKRWSMKNIQKVIRRFVRSQGWTIFMLVMIIYVLLVDDFVAMARAYKDHGLGVGIGASKMVILALFILEFFALLFSSRKEYNPFTLFFWLDLLSIGSMIPDILLLAYNDHAPHTVSMLAIARAGRAARAAGRVARILRVVEFYSCFGIKRKVDEEQERKDSDASSINMALEPSKMGNRLINSTTNKVVVIVLILLFITTVLQTDLDATQFVRAGMSELEALHDSNNTVGYNAALERYVSNQRDLIYLQVRDSVIVNKEEAVNGLFDTSILKYTGLHDNTGTSGVLSVAWYDNSDQMATEGGYNLGILILVIILLTGGNLLIIRDATRLVITPMERVLAVLKQLTPDSQAPKKKDRDRPRDRRSRDFTDTATDDLTTTTSMDDDDDEAEAIFGMLNDIDGNLQAARERAEYESGENSRLRDRVMDLVAEKKLLEIQVSGIKRRIHAANKEGDESAPKIEIVDVVESAVQAYSAMSRTSTVPKVNFGFIIGGKKFTSYKESDSTDIKFIHAAPSSPPTLQSPPSQSSATSLDAAESSSPVSSRLEIPQVQAATLERLIERLTYDEYSDAKFINVFLLTYRSLLPPIDLMEQLYIRYCSVTPTLSLPKETSGEAIDEWRKQKQELVRMGVYNALKFWVGRYFWDFRENEQLQEMLHDFMFNLLPSTNMDRHAVNIESLYNKKMEEERNESRIPYASPPTLTEDEATALGSGASDFSRFEVAELAAQITLLEHELFCAIKPSELLGQAWTKKNKERDSPNILRLIDHFNNISAWIKTQIVKLPKAKERATVIKRAILLGEEFLKLKNFNGAMEVLAALSNASVSRLKRTWEVIPAASNESFHELGQIMSSQSSFKLYRERLRSSPPPCIPYIGVYLSDLVFIDEGNPDRLEDSGLINFDKHRQVAAVIAEIQRFQQLSYEERGGEDGLGIDSNPEIIEFIKAARGIDDDMSYKISLNSEPRARAGSIQGDRPSLTPSSSFLQRLRNSSPSGTL